jgi:hypothetical protein
MYCIGIREQATRSGPLALGLGEVLTTLRPNNLQSLGNISQGLGLGTIVWHGTDVTQGTNRWRALMNVVMNLRAPYNVGNFLKLMTCWLLRTDCAPWG